MSTKKLFYGDNLEILREQIDDESVDLIYLDPPFNSNRDYNAIFRGGESDTAQIHAFGDSWSWGLEAERAIADLKDSGHAKIVAMLESFIDFLGRNDAAAYLAMMAPRLVELHRVLKPTGSIYLHCDPTMSHYLKILLDQVFGTKNFRNELIWSYRRWPAKQENFQRMHDTIFRYSKTEKVIWNQLFEPLAASTLKQWGKGKQDAVFDETGKRKHSSTLEEKSKGAPMRDTWDISIIAPTARERLGYPTQKPVALLKRILEASSDKNSVILDPFCGCGTTLAAAEMLSSRNWVGIDITPIAINVIAKRLKENFDLKVGTDFEIRGLPADFAGAKKLAAQKDKYDFEWWAVSLLNCQPSNDSKKGADGGFDGFAWFDLVRLNDRKGKMIVEVKSSKAGRRELDIFSEAMKRQKADLGVFIGLENKNLSSELATHAAAAGFFELRGQKIPRIQIWSIEDLYAEKMPVLPFGVAGHTRAQQVLKKEKGNKQTRAKI